MNKIIILGASNSTTSINASLASYAGSLLTDCESLLLDISDLEMPIYSPERESKDGIPVQARKFVEHLEAADGIILSLAEHNGSYSAAFKNILDWSSRHKQKLWSDKPMLLMSTSPGARAGATVLRSAETSFPHLGAKIEATFSLPSFYDNYKENEGITDKVLKENLESAVKKFASNL